MEGSEITKERGEGQWKSGQGWLTGGGERGRNGEGRGYVGNTNTGDTGRR